VTVALVISLGLKRSVSARIISAVNPTGVNRAEEPTGGHRLTNAAIQRQTNEEKHVKP